MFTPVEESDDEATIEKEERDMEKVGCHQTWSVSPLPELVFMYFNSHLVYTFPDSVHFTTYM